MSAPIVEKINAALPETVVKSEEFRNDLTVTVKKQEIVRACEFLKNDPSLSFDMVIDVCGVDMYRPEGRFEVVYNLYSLKYKNYVRLKVVVEEDDPVVQSVTGVWP